MRKIDRYAGRIIPITLEGKVLLIKGHDADNKEYSWWFTIGGGLQENETIKQCAVREFYEETGIKIDVNILDEPFIVRNGKFDFTCHTLYQKDYIYLLLFEKPLPFKNDNFSVHERNVIDEVKWWNIDDLCKKVIEGEIILFPTGLEKIIKDVYLKEVKNNFFVLENKKYGVLGKNITYEIDDISNSIKRL